MLHPRSHYAYAVKRCTLDQHIVVERGARVSLPHCTAGMQQGGLAPNFKNGHGATMLWECIVSTDIKHEVGSNRQLLVLILSTS